MRKTYRIEADCANCAAKMEAAVKKIAGVKDAVVNFMALRLTVEFQDGADAAAVMRSARAAARRVDSDLEIYI